MRFYTKLAVAVLFSLVIREVHSPIYADPYNEEITNKKTFQLPKTNILPRKKEAKSTFKKVELNSNKKRCIAKWVSEEDEIKFGHYVDAIICNKFIMLEEDSSLVLAVKAIGEEISKLSERPNLPYKFKVINTITPNAFAGPGGYIYITTGLLERLDTKDEVAVVLSHEIGHVCGRHAIIQLQNAQNTQLIGGILSIAATVAVAATTYDRNTGTYNEDLSNSAGQAAYVAAIIVNQGYSREQEREADRDGIIYMKKTGYMPEAAICVFKKLQTIEKEQFGREIRFSLLSTHPSAESRIKNIEKTIKILGKKEEVL